jgi:hypothetical protein
MDRRSAFKSGPGAGDPATERMKSSESGMANLEIVYRRELMKFGSGA